MRTQKFEVLQSLLGILQEGRPAYLITVLETWGASPRPAGSLLCFDAETNQVFGSVSGGCIEMDLLSELKGGVCSTQWPDIRSYGEHHGSGLPCGATLSLLIEYLEPNVPAQFAREESNVISQFERLVEYLELGKACKRKVDLKAKATSLDEVVGRDAGAGCLVHSVHNDSVSVTQYFETPDRMLVVGAGDVSESLIPLAQQIGYRVTLVEPRAEVMERVKSTAADVLIVDQLPDDVVQREYMQSASAVVAISHDPRLDDLALLAALQGEAHFVGALGSERTTSKRKERLLSLGVTKAQLDRLKAPIGLDIGSRTPMEIAISIAAQLIENRQYLVGKDKAAELFDRIEL